jgi:hypothetical protein
MEHAAVNQKPHRACTAAGAVLVTRMLVALGCACLLPACGSTSSTSSSTPCEHLLAEPGYPWSGTQTVTRIEFEQGPLQR